jgi:hypothetical protein
MTHELKIVDDFDRVWRKPSADELVSLLHEEVVLYQPHLPPIKGIQDAHLEFVHFLKWMPSFYGEVKHAAQNGNVIFIEWQMNFQLKNVLVPIRAVDRIIIEDHLIRERHVVFNTLPLIKKIITMPSEWSAYYKYRFRRPDPGLLIKVPF